MIQDAQTALRKSQVYTSSNGLNELKRQARQDSNAALDQVAKQFEALFMQMMLKSMRDATIEGGLFESSQSKMYTDLFDKQIGIQMSEQGGLGLADMVVQQMRASAAVLPVKTDDPVTAGNTVPGREQAVNRFMPIARRDPQSQAMFKLAAQQAANLQMPKRESAKMFKLDWQDRANLHQSKQVSASTSAQDLQRSAGLRMPGLTLTLPPVPVSESMPAAMINRAVAPSPEKTPESFVNSIWNKVKEVGQKLGVSPVAVLAQTVLETGWGKFIAKDRFGRSSNNLFNIKSSAHWRGATVPVSTNEYESGIRLRKQQSFKMYADKTASFDDYVKLIKNSPRYQSVLASGSDIDRFAKALQKSGYATDPDYGRKLIGLVNSPRFQSLVKSLQQ